MATLHDSAPLMRYDAACRAVAEAKSIDEVKDFRDKAEAMRAYAKQAKNKQLEIDASEIRFRAERRIGELMAAQREAGLLSEGGRPKTGLGQNPVSSMRFINEFEDRAPYGPPERPITLTEAGIDKNLADRARKYAAVPEQEFESILADRRERIETENKRVTVNLIEAGVRGTLGTGENEWYTPPEYIELARQVLGGIDLDPASSHVANRAVQAAQFFSEETNGLEKEWAGRVWLNPPYAQPAISHFADKMVAEWESARVEGAIVLTHNYTDTAWFQKLANAASAICFTRGRVRFVSPTGELAAPTQGQAFFYFGHEADLFADAFADVGFIVEVRR
mgnify:CR=1 FL=1